MYEHVSVERTRGRQPLPTDRAQVVARTGAGRTRLFTLRTLFAGAPRVQSLSQRTRVVRADVCCEFAEYKSSLVKMVN